MCERILNLILCCNNSLEKSWTRLFVDHVVTSSLPNLFTVGNTALLRRNFSCLSISVNNMRLYAYKTGQETDTESEDFSLSKVEYNRNHTQTFFLRTNIYFIEFLKSCWSWSHCLICSLLHRQSNQTITVLMNGYRHL